MSKVAQASTGKADLQRTENLEFSSSTIVFAYEAGDENRTRITSLGMVTVPA